ncbi:MAG TPA: sugar phosphate isomerase/epimerase [Chthonomonas sp.]|uniref:sugar phosphate isomerase/epimerase family protein n=1 Tax=Chthonomonas sp. TaxID=2282153 RepID=UPI002B4B1DB9|nr:sugar phosphate isomerase/epimerase [Chthonomonas sp.]HLI49191.1 sugar phosphate isomerase/epimerase [Chthonomonas sp.]
MKIGIFTALFHDRPIEQALDYIAEAGIQTVEFGGGAYPGSRHLNDLGGVQTLIEDESARKRLLKMCESRGLEISAISVHGNPLHPDKTIAQDHHNAFRNAVLLAEKLGVGVVNGFSGCPAGGPDDKNPNWVTCAWPDEYRDILDYQWNKVAIPYWKEQNAFLKQHNVKYAIEAHPGFIVYNPETVIKLREAAGEQIGCNFDPSHFWWQGIEPLNAVRYLGPKGAIFHVHAKDTRIDPINSAINGNLDVKSYGAIAERSWVFRSVGYGHSQQWWNDFVTTLRMVGYDYVLSIEHEDGMMSTREGLTKALQTLKVAVVQEKPGAMFWARE